MACKSCALALAASCLVAAMARAGDAVPRADPASYRVETVAAGLDRPWSLAFLPDGRRLVTEQGGRLRLVATDGALSTVALDGMPPIYSGGQNGLMDVAIDPDFAGNQLIYLTFTTGTKDSNTTSLARARLEGDRLEEIRTLFGGTPKSGDSNNGGRIAFLPDGTILLTLGDGFDRREDAQNPSNMLGKIVRLTREGAAPQDNPFVGRASVAPELYSLGHRNVQGIAVDPEGGGLIVAEHGARGGDEINLVRPGGNYGWPVVTGGLDYTFARVSPFTALPGYEPPALEWTPSIAPAGLAIYRGVLFADWRGDLFVAALKERAIRRVRREGGRIVGQELLLADRGERIRDVRAAPDGSLQALTDGDDGRLLRLIPARGTAAP